jgi:hypothetical protein
LEWLADLELEARKGRAVERRFHCSRLHVQHSIDSFPSGATSSTTPPSLQLSPNRLVENSEVILLGGRGIR